MTMASARWFASRWAWVPWGLGEVSPSTTIDRAWRSDAFCAAVGLDLLAIESS